VIFNDLRKYDMIQFCELAADVGRTVDPDGLIEDRDVEVIRGYGRSTRRSVTEQPTSTEWNKRLIASVTPSDNFQHVQLFTRMFRI
jgi:hypothetical protein